MKRLYLQLNEPGSGEITLPLDSAQASAITLDSWVDLTYRGDSLGGFWVENIDKNYTDPQENGARKFHATGRGAMAILDDAILWDWMTPADENVRYFKDPPDGSVVALTKKGAILNQIFNEAITAQTNYSGDTMDRQCFHDALGTHILTWDFSATADSDSTVWDAAEDEDIQIRIGKSYLDILRQFVALGQPTAPNTFEVNSTHDKSTGVTNISIHQAPIGVSAANANVHLRVGHNCTLAAEKESGKDIRNAVLIESAVFRTAYENVTDPTSITTHRRREVLLQAASANSSTTATSYGTAELTHLKDSLKTVTVKVTDATGPKYGTNYNLGDWVYFDDGTGAEAQYRIRGVRLEWDDNWFADVVLELNSVQMEADLRIQRDMRKYGAQSSGSDLMDQSGQGGAIPSSVHIRSGDAAKGEVLTADGGGYTDWQFVDGGHAPAGGTDPTVLLHFDGPDDSTTIVDEMGGTFVTNGSAKLDDAQYKFDPTALLVAGKTDYVSGTIAASGTGDFTWEMFIRPTNMTGDGDNNLSALCGTNFVWNDNGGVTLGMNTDGTLFLYPGYNSGYNKQCTTLSKVTLNTWSHVALMRYGNKYYIFVDGVRGPDWSNTNNLINTSLRIGCGLVTGDVGGFFGSIDEFHSFNYAKYLANFIPPTLPYVLAGEIERAMPIRFRRGPAANLPGLDSGEPYIETDTGILHVGPWTYNHA
jgi:hypothetical protein